MMKEFHVRAAMIDGIALVTYDSGSPLIESERRMSEISGQNLDTTLVPARRKLSLVERPPQTGFGRLPVRGTDMAGDMRVGLLEQRGGETTADEAGGSGQENAFGLVRRARAGQLDVRRQEDVAGQVRRAGRRRIKVARRRGVAAAGRHIDP